MSQSAALESTRDAWGVCVIAGWTETEAMSVLVEKILMGRTLKGTYFGGKLKPSFQTDQLVRLLAFHNASITVNDLIEQLSVQRIIVHDSP